MSDRNPSGSQETGRNIGAESDRGASETAHERTALSTAEDTNNDDSGYTNTENSE